MCDSNDEGKNRTKKNVFGPNGFRRMDDEERMPVAAAEAPTTAICKKKMKKPHTKNAHTFCSRIFVSPSNASVCVWVSADKEINIRIKM